MYVLVFVYVYIYIYIYTYHTHAHVFSPSLCLFLPFALPSSLPVSRASLRSDHERAAAFVIGLRQCCPALTTQKLALTPRDNNLRSFFRCCFP